VADPRETSASRRPDITSLRPDEFDSSIFDKAASSEEEVRPEGEDDFDVEGPAPRREGLPPGFRMRHDAHYVEELMSRNHAGRVRVVSTSESESPLSPGAREREAAGATRPAPSLNVGVELGESLDAIGACVHLFRDTSRPPAERIALDLIEAEVFRATWLLQALSVLDEDPPIANRPVDLDTVVKRLARALAPGRSLTGPALEIEAGLSGVRAQGDEPLLTVAMAGMVMALQAAAERAGASAVRIRVVEDQAGRVRIEATEDAVRIPASWRARFLDPEWTDRPGGRRTAVALAAARRIAELHRGTLTFSGAEHGGCRLVLSLPRG
jgi:signal transduction histidine kinase